VRFRWERRPAEVLRLTRVPAHRAFTNLVHLSVASDMTGDIQEAALYIDAAAAAAAAWPGLEKAGLSCYDMAW
jgi:hypothetical protein